MLKITVGAAVFFPFSSVQAETCTICIHLSHYPSPAWAGWGLSDPVWGPSELLREDPHSLSQDTWSLYQDPQNLSLTPQSSSWNPKTRYRWMFHLEVHHVSLLISGWIWPAMCLSVIVVALSICQYITIRNIYRLSLSRDKYLVKTAQNRPQIR